MNKQRVILCVALFAGFVGSAISSESRPYATLIKAVAVKIPYGQTEIPAGTRLEILSSDATTVRVNYMGSVHALPIQAVVISPASNDSGKKPSSETVAQQPPPSQTPTVHPELTTNKQMEAATYVVKTDKGQGSAFLVRMAEKSYLVTNYHVLCGARTAQFVRLVDVIALEPASAIEVANDRDLVRIPVQTDAKLEPADSPSLNESVDVYGNPGGQEVVTQEPGKLLGIGPTEIEVSAKFILGNSGGPIVQKDTARVIGVATYLTKHADMAKWITNKTRFEEARRFGVRLDRSITWSQSSWNSFCNDTSLVVSIDELLNESVALARLLASTPYRTPFRSSLQPSYELGRLKCWQVYQGVVNAYNGSCAEYARTLDTPVYDASLVRQSNSFFEQRIRGHASNLGQCLQEAAKDFRHISHRFSDQHSRDEYAKLVARADEFGAFLRTRSADIANKNIFRLAPSNPTDQNADVQ